MFDQGTGAIEAAVVDAVLDSREKPQSCPATTSVIGIEQKGQSSHPSDGLTRRVRVSWINLGCAVRRTRRVLAIHATDDSATATSAANARRNRVCMRGTVVHFAGTPTPYL